MSDKITALAQQATTDVLGVPVLDQQHFAKLIIQECIDICEQGNDTQASSGGAAVKIKLHFGV